MSELEELERLFLHCHYDFGWCHTCDKRFSIKSNGLRVEYTADACVTSGHDVRIKVVI